MNLPKLLQFNRCWTNFMLVKICLNSFHCGVRRPGWYNIKSVYVSRVTVMLFVLMMTSTLICLLWFSDHQSNNKPLTTPLTTQPYSPSPPHSNSPPTSSSNPPISTTHLAPTKGKHTLFLVRLLRATIRELSVSKCKFRGIKMKLIVCSVTRLVILISMHVKIRLYPVRS